jgi:PAS domain S-box-containing protein
VTGRRHPTLADSGLTRPTLSIVAAVVALALLLVAGHGQITAWWQGRLEAAFTDDTKAEMALLRQFVEDTLQRTNYQDIDGPLELWGRARTDIASIRLLAADGLVLAEYRGAAPGADPLSLRQHLPLGEHGSATLELNKDRAQLRREARHFELELAGAAGGAWLITLLLLWSFRSRRHMAAAIDAGARALRRSHVQLAESSEKLQHQRIFLDGLLDSIPAALVGVDGDGRIIEWNRGAALTTQIPREDAMGLQPWELLPYLEKYEQPLREAIREQRERRLPRLTQVTGGTVGYLDILVLPMSNDPVRAALIRVEDATQQVHFEQMMVQSDRLRSLSSLATGVAHEINSPLSGVLQNCQNVARRLSNDLVDNRKAAEAAGLDLERLQDYLQQRKIPECIGRVREAAERASHIIADLVAFTRRSPEGCEKVALGDLLETALRLACSDYDMGRHLNFRRIAIQRDTPPDLPFLYCDRPRVEQSLLNLLQHCAQTMNAAGTPTPTIRLRARAAREVLRIDLEDNGPGMDELSRQRAFEPFSSLDRTDSGLGLSVCRFILTELHGGSIEVDADYSAGTRFIIRLPLGMDCGLAQGGFSRDA